MAGPGRIEEFGPGDRDSGGESRTMGLHSHKQGDNSALPRDLGRGDLGQGALSTLSFSFLIYGVAVTPDEGGKCK